MSTSTDRIEVRPEGASKSSTLSMTAQVWGCRITQNVADCIRCLVEEGLDGRTQRSRSQRSLNDPTGVCAGRVAVFGGHDASMGTFRLNIHYFINNASIIEIMVLPLR